MTKGGSKPGEDVESKFRSNLLALVSHELNTPLTGILNAISILETRFPAEDEYLDMLKRNAHRLHRTVENMLRLAESDAGLLRVHLTEAKLENLLRLSMEKLRPSLERSGFEFAADIESDLPSVCCDPTRLGRVMDALIANCVKFSQKEPARVGKRKLNLALEMKPMPGNERTGLFLVLTLSSSEAPLGDLPKSFDDFFAPFSPWKDVNSREKDGLGVELALAREILSAHHGFISANPPENKGQGIVFSLGLPVLSRQDELEFVINNRLQGALGNLTKTSILMIRPDPESTSSAKPTSALEDNVRGLLYRSSDSVFRNSATGEITIVMDDCNARGAERLADRLGIDLRKQVPGLEFLIGTATGPDDGATAADLISFASHSWRPA